MLKKLLIINADGYGITKKINKAIEECIDFGTVRSISANINFPFADHLKVLAKNYPKLSIGCHLNPIIGRPVLPQKMVKSLVNDDGEFFYRDFDKRLYSGFINLNELKAELFAQIDRCREFAGSCFSHIDCHMGKHRLPRFYPIFLSAVHYSGTKRIRTHKYRLAMESEKRLIGILRYYLRHPLRVGIFFWNLQLRHKAKKQQLLMPDWRLCISDMGDKSGTISLNTWVNLLKNVPEGISEFVVHPAYLDHSLKKYSTYISQRNEERIILTSKRFKDSLQNHGIKLAGYRDI